MLFDQEMVLFDQEMMQMDGSIEESVREEARRAKAIAVEKYKAGNFAGAKEFAVKAKDLDPELCGLRRLNAVLDVRTAFEKKICGELTDWYAVLAVAPKADIETIKNGYTKLTLDIIHDADHSVGSYDEAFRILADAWTSLCYEEKKQRYDTRRRFHVIIRIGKDGGRRDRLDITPTMIGSALVEKGTSTIFKMGLEKCVSAEETETLQDSYTGDMFKEEEPDVVESVQGPDVYIFNKDRLGVVFLDNQIWAAYDHGGKRRFYALVHSLVPQEPFPLCISWLNSKSDEDLGMMKNWTESRFYNTTGRRNTESFYSFSHKVQWTEDPKGFVQIYPAQGDVCSKWSPSWDSSAPKEVVNDYEMVEALQDFNQEVGVMVMPLVEVPGFKNVFHRHSNMLTFTLKELLRLSHKRVSHTFTGQEGEYPHEGCLELDQEALSPELLKVVTEEEMREVKN